MFRTGVGVRAEMGVGKDWMHVAGGIRAGVVVRSGWG